MMSNDYLGRNYIFRQCFTVWIIIACWHTLHSQRQFITQCNNLLCILDFCLFLLTRSYCISICPVTDIRVCKLISFPFRYICVIIFHLGYELNILSYHSLFVCGHHCDKHAPKRYSIQWWYISMAPYGVTKPRWVNTPYAITQRK